MQRHETALKHSCL